MSKVHLQVYMPGNLLRIDNMDAQQATNIIGGYAAGLFSGQMLTSVEGMPFQYAIRMDQVSALCAVPTQPMMSGRK